MKKLLIIMGAAFCCAFMNVNAQTLFKDTPSTPVWTSTGITVTNGQAVTINTYGQWDWWTGNITGADGVLLVDDIPFERFLSSALHGSIIAFVGTNTNPNQGHLNGIYADGFFPQLKGTGYWELGSAAQFISDRTGTLWLGVNDDAGPEGNDGDNSGTLHSHVFLDYGKTNNFDCGPALCEGTRTNSYSFSFTVTGDAYTKWGVYASADLANWVFLDKLDIGGSGATNYTALTTVPYRFYKLDNGMCHSKAIGYVEITVPPTNSLLLADQLTSCPSPGSNTVEVILASVPEGTVLLKYNVGTHQYDTNTFASGSWSSPTTTLNPGEGGFLYNPTASPLTVTFTGLVPEGHLVNPLPHGTYIRSSIVPQAGPIASFLEYPAEGHSIVQWNAATRSYYSELCIGGSWYGDGDVEPVIRVGEAFWVENAGAATNWIRDFSIWKSPSP